MPLLCPRPAHPRRRSAIPRLTSSGLGLAILLGVSAPAKAQSLFELYEAARGFDATYRAARALADSAQYRAEQVYALRRPQVGLGASLSHSTSDDGTGDAKLRTASVSVNATQTLFNRANDVAIAQAKKSLDEARADVALAEHDLILRVSQAYFDVLGAQDALSAAQATRTAISEQLASVKRSFEVGTGTVTDTREAQARFDLATAQEIAAENELRTRRIALETLIGRNALRPRPLAGPIALEPLAPGPVEQWVSATDDAPAVRKALVGYDVARLETDKARANRLPTVGLSGGVGRVNTRASPETPINQSGSATTTTVSVVLNLPLFTGHATQNRIRETLLLEEQSRNILEAARRSVAQTTRVAYFSVQSQQAQVKALEAAESSSQLALDATQLGYRAGVRVNLDVLNAQTQLFTTRRDLAKARYAVLVEALNLRRAAGTLKADDVLAVSRLLAK
jgi:outer membrane protein